jgi:predicted dehydrogenase
MDVGLIGCGSRAARLHMRAYKHIPEVRVVAVSDINLERARAYTQEYHIKRFFKDYKELFELKNLDYIDICTPTSTHTEIACEAAKYGLNILLEKPMARTSSDCDKIISEVSKHRVKLCMCHNQIFADSVIYVKNLVDNGEFPIIYFGILAKENIKMSRPPDWATTNNEEGGALWESGVHSAYLQLHFLKDIQEVFAIGDKIKHSVYDNYIVLLRGLNQVIGMIELSWITRRSEFLFDFMSSDGRRIQIFDYDFIQDIPEKPSANILQGFYRDQRAIIKKWGKIIKNFHNQTFGLHHYTLIKKFIRSLEIDSDPPVKPEDGRRSIALLECIEESLNKNLIVRFDNS